MGSSRGWGTTGVHTSSDKRSVIPSAPQQPQPLSIAVVAHVDITLTFPNPSFDPPSAVLPLLNLKLMQEVTDGTVFLLKNLHLY